MQKSVCHIYWISFNPMAAENARYIILPTLVTIVYLQGYAIQNLKRGITEENIYLFNRLNFGKLNCAPFYSRENTGQKIKSRNCRSCWMDCMLSDSKCSFLFLLFLVNMVINSQNIHKKTVKYWFRLGQITTKKSALTAQSNSGNFRFKNLGKMLF